MRKWVLKLLVVGLCCQFSAWAKLNTEDSCETLLKENYQRGFNLQIPLWQDDLGLIRADLETQAWSTVRTFFSDEFDTQFYHTATGVPDKTNLEIPLVDLDSKGVVIFFHGSGTAKSSGSNFVSNMSALSRFGYSSVAFDMPFHSHGSLKSKFMEADHFMDWIKAIVDRVKSYGKPVYFAGHSFGPDVILEFISRYPNAVQGVLAISPAGFDSETREWYRKFTSRMKFGDSTATNTLGGEWSEVMSSQFGWTRGNFPDPTLVNPKLKVRVLSGDREEYLPAPVGGPKGTPTGKNTYDISRFFRERFSNSEVVLAEGVGHYLFDHQDEKGDNVVQREILKLVQSQDRPSSVETIKQVGQQREGRPSYERLSLLYAQDLIFRSWFESSYNVRTLREVLRREDQKWAQSILNEFVEAKEIRYQQLMNLVYATEATAPEFFRANKIAIEKAREKKRIDNTLLATYYKFVNKGASISIN